MNTTEMIYSFISNNIEAALSLIATIAVFLMVVAGIAFVMTFFRLLLAHRKCISKTRIELQKYYDDLKWEETWKKTRKHIRIKG